MDESRQIRVRQAFEEFFQPGQRPEGWVLDLFRRTADTVPAYRKFLREHGIEPGTTPISSSFP